MPTRFPGFSSKALSFFRELEKNNDRNWFAAHKEVYESEIRRPIIELTTLLCEDFRRLAVDYVPEKPERAIYRIYRDTRFSHDKTPYKTHVGVHFQHRRVPKNAGAGFYFEISHRAVGIGGGMYMPGPEQLAAVRGVLVEKWKQFDALCTDRRLTKVLGPLQGEKLARVPKGYDPQSPAADYLRYKHFYYYVELPAKTAQSPAIYKEILTHLKPLVPFNQFLNEAIIRAVREEEDSRPVRPEPMF